MLEFSLIVFAAGVVYFVWMQFEQMAKIRQRTKALDEIDTWLEPYRQQLRGNNRFLINRQMLSYSFPQYKDDTIEIWKAMVADGMVVKDPIDDEWIVNKFYVRT